MLQTRRPDLLERGAKGVEHALAGVGGDRLLGLFVPMLDKLGRQIVQHKIPVLLTTKGDCALAVKTAEKSADYAISAGIFENTSQLCDNLHKFIKPDDIILVKASRSERFEAVIDKLKTLLSDNNKKI